MPLVEESNLIARWTFAESSAGDTVVDLTAGGASGTPEGASGTNNLPQPIADVPTSVSSLVRSSSFDGVDDAVVFSQGDISFAGDWTLCGWVKTATSPDGPLLLDFRKGPFTNAVVCRAISSTSIRTLCRFGGTNFDATSTVTDVTGDWHWFCLLRLGDTIFFYIDNSQVATGAVTGTVDPLWDEISIGKTTDPSLSNKRFLEAKYSDHRMYSKALSSSERAAIYVGDLGTATPSPRRRRSMLMGGPSL